MAYCGLVEVCIRKASLNTFSSRCSCSESWTRICEACDSPASTLWVDWVAKTIERSQRGRSALIACMPR